MTMNDSHQNNIHQFAKPSPLKVKTLPKMNWRDFAVLTLVLMLFAAMIFASLPRSIAPDQEASLMSVVKPSVAQQTSKPTPAKVPNLFAANK